MNHANPRAQRQAQPAEHLHQGERAFQPEEEHGQDHEAPHRHSTHVPHLRISTGESL